MGRIAYVNGRFLPHGEAFVHIEDRGYQLADGIYEVWAVFDGRLADFAGHMARLWRSLGELRIKPPLGEAALKLVLKETIRRNRLVDGLLYLQVTRGVAPRDHAFPNDSPRPSLVVTAKRVDMVQAEARSRQGVKVITLAESRWNRCDIKSIGLLPNVLARQRAKEEGAAEAWFVDELGFVTEGAASNAWILDRDGRLRTRDIQANILRGVTRSTLLAVMDREGFPCDERPFTVAEAMGAREAFITGAGSLVTPVVQVDGAIVGDGCPGPVAKRLRRLYIEEARRGAF